MGFSTALFGEPSSVVPALQSFKELKSWFVSLENYRPSWVSLSFPPNRNSAGVGHPRQHPLALTDGGEIDLPEVRVQAPF